MHEYEIYEAVTSMRNHTARMDREGDYWTEEEKEQLVKLFREGKGITAIAIRLQRTEPAIMQQIEKMDLYRRKESPARRKSTPRPPACLYDNCQLDPASCPRCGACLQLEEGEYCLRIILISSQWKRLAKLSGWVITLCTNS